MTIGKGSAWDVTRSPTFRARNSKQIEALYSTELPPNRETDPASWDSLIGFFTSLLIDLSQHPGHLLLPSPVTNTTLALLLTPPPHPPPPHLTEILVQALSQSPPFIPADSLHLPPPPPPSLLTRLVRRVTGAPLWGKAEIYVAEDVLRERVGKLEKVVKTEGWGGSLGIVGMELVADRVCGGSLKEAEAVLSYGEGMERVGGCLIRYGDGENRKKKRWGWKVGKREEGDGEILELFRVLKEGEKTLEELSERWKELGRKALVAKERGDRGGCLGFLKRRREVEKRRKNGEGIIHKIETVLTAIEDGRRMKGVVDVIGKGVKVAKEQNVLVEQVEQVMEEWEDLREDIEEVNKVWETAATGPLPDVSDEDLLDELEFLAKKEEEQREGEKITSKKQAEIQKSGEVQIKSIQKRTRNESPLGSAKMAPAVPRTRRTSGVIITAPVETASDSSIEEKKEGGFANCEPSKDMKVQDLVTSQGKEACLSPSGAKQESIADSGNMELKKAENGPASISMSKHDSSLDIPTDASYLVEAMQNLSMDTTSRSRQGGLTERNTEVSGSERFCSSQKLDGSHTVDDETVSRLNVTKALSL